MSSFWELVHFEYKKIFCKKSTAILLAAALALIVFSGCAVLIGSHYVEGVPVSSKMEDMKKDRANGRALAGRAVDSELLVEMSDAYDKIPDAPQYTETAEYAKYARPYSDIYSIARTVYHAVSDRFELADVKALSKEQADLFYEIRADKVSKNVDSMIASLAAKEKSKQLNSQVELPFIYDYTDGYTRFFSIMYTSGLVSLFVAAVLLAPLFSREYSSGTDQLILSAKRGKHELILAKLFVGITTAGGLSLILTAVTYIEQMLLYGADGAGAALQVYIPMCAYPLHMWQAALAYFVCSLMGTVMVAAITMLLSAKMKTPFGVIVIMCIFIILPMFVTDPETNAVLSNLICILPINMTAFWSIISPHLFELGSIAVEPYVAMPIIAGIVAVVLLPFAHRGFKNHQIG